MTKTDKSFLKVLPRMSIFWLSLLVLVIGLISGSCFLVWALDADLYGVAFGVVFAFVVGISVITCESYKTYGRMQRIPQEAEEVRRSATRAIIASIPLVLGGITMLYLLATNRLVYIVVVGALCVTVWAVLRYFLKKWAL